MGPLLFVSYSGAFGGAERVLLDCAHAVAEDPCLACPDGPLADRARAAGLTVLIIPARRPNLRASGRERARPHLSRERSLAKSCDALSGLSQPTDAPPARSQWRVGTRP